MPLLKVIIRDSDRLLFSSELSEPLELGRQRKDEPSPSAAVPCPLLPGSPARLLLAPKNENNAGRQHVLLEPLSSGNVSVHNGSQIPLAHDQGSIAPGAFADLAPLFTLQVSSRPISVLPPGADDSAEEHGVHALDEMTKNSSSISTLFGIGERCLATSVVSLCCAECGESRAVLSVFLGKTRVFCSGNSQPNAIQ